MPEWGGWHYCSVFISFLIQISAGRLVTLTAVWENSKIVSENRSEPIISFCVFIISFQFSFDWTVDHHLCQVFRTFLSVGCNFAAKSPSHLPTQQQNELIVVSTSLLKSWVCFLCDTKNNSWRSCCDPNASTDRWWLGNLLGEEKMP
jgi:hypothetical protein